jgi:hypothetical protein
MDDAGNPVEELPPLRIIVLAYADDVLILCNSEEDIRALADDMQDWAENFGFEVGCGNGKSEAMFFDWKVITEASSTSNKQKRTGGSKPYLNTLDGRKLKSAVTTAPQMNAWTLARVLKPTPGGDGIESG